MGVDVEKYPEKARSYLGYMAQKFSLYSRLSVLDNLNFFGGIYGLFGSDKRKRIENILEVFDLENYKNMMSSELPFELSPRQTYTTYLCYELHTKN